MNLLELPSGWRDRAIVISDVADSETWFTADELREAAGFRLEKRRQEWMLSRVAAKQLALERGICLTPRECRIVERRIGSHFVSFSHSQGYAAAAIDDKPVGIDVERVRPIKAAAAHLFLSPDEEREFAACEISNALLHFWSAKEAAWKRVGGSVPTLSRVPLRLQSVSESGLVFEGGVETVAVGDVVVALSITQPTFSSQTTGTEGCVAPARE